MITVILVFYCELTQKRHRDGYIIEVVIILLECMMTNVFNILCFILSILQTSVTRAQNHCIT